MKFNLTSYIIIVYILITHNIYKKYIYKIFKVFYKSLKNMLKYSLMNKNLIESIVPMKRFATPGEIADSAVFLCSDRSSFITGATLVIDGGQTSGGC